MEFPIQRCCLTLVKPVCHADSASTTMKPQQNGRRLADDTFWCISLNVIHWIVMQIPLRFGAKGPVDDNNDNKMMIMTMLTTMITMIMMMIIIVTEMVMMMAMAKAMAMMMVMMVRITIMNNSNSSLQWRHNEHGGISNHRRLDCLLKPFVQAHIKGNIKDPCHWPLWWASAGERWIPLTKDH